MSTRERNQKLGRAFQFTSADVLLNQQGRIADSQKPNLERFRRGRVMALTAYAVFAGMALLACIGSAVWAAFNPEAGVTRLVVPLGIGFVVLAMAGGAANFYFRSRPVITGEVSRIEGAAKPFTRNFGPEAGLGSYVKIGSAEFRLFSPEQYEAFEESASYRIHYVKNYPYHVILSVEAL